MNQFHLQFENLAYESLKLFEDIFFEMAQLAKYHPVVANALGFLFGILLFGINYLFIDFLEEKYVPKIKAIIFKIKAVLVVWIKDRKRSLTRYGKKCQKAAKRMVEHNLLLLVFGLPLFFVGCAFRGGIKR